VEPCGLGGTRARARRTRQGKVGSSKLEVTPSSPLLSSLSSVRPERLCARNKPGRSPLKPGHGFVTSPRGRDCKPPSTSALNYTSETGSIDSIPTILYGQLINTLLFAPDSQFQPGVLAPRSISCPPHRCPLPSIIRLVWDIPCHHMPRHVKIHFVPLRSSLVNLPISIYGPLLQRNAVSARSCLSRHSVIFLHPQRPQGLAIQLALPEKNIEAFVGWTGMASASSLAHFSSPSSAEKGVETLEIDPQFAQSLGFGPGDVVRIGSRAPVSESLRSLSR